MNILLKIIVISIVLLSSCINTQVKTNKSKTSQETESCTNARIPSDGNICIKEGGRLVPYNNDYDSCIDGYTCSNGTGTPDDPPNDPPVGTNSCTNELGVVIEHEKLSCKCSSGSQGAIEICNNGTLEVNSLLNVLCIDNQNSTIMSAYCPTYKIENNVVVCQKSDGTNINESFCAGQTKPTVCTDATLSQTSKTACENDGGSYDPVQNDNDLCIDGYQCVGAGVNPSDASCTGEFGVNVLHGESTCNCSSGALGSVYRCNNGSLVFDHNRGEVCAAGNITMENYHCPAFRININNTKVCTNYVGGVVTETYCKDQNKECLPPVYGDMEQQFIQTCRQQSGTDIAFRNMVGCHIDYSCLKDRDLILALLRLKR